MKQLFKCVSQMRSLLIGSSVAYGLFLIGSCPLQAQTLEAPSARQVIVGGTLFLTVRSAWGGMSPEQRAQKVQDRINHALSIGPVYPQDITIGLLDGDWVVFLKGERLYTADEISAQANQLPAKQLAQKWADSLKKILPGLTAPTNNPPAGAPTATTATGALTTPPASNQ